MASFPLPTSSVGVSVLEIAHLQRAEHTENRWVREGKLIHRCATEAKKFDPIIDLKPVEPGSPGYPQVDLSASVSLRNSRTRC